VFVIMNSTSTISVIITIAKERGDGAEMVLVQS
jgi:hypothetical protein